MGEGKEGLSEVVLAWYALLLCVHLVQARRSIDNRPGRILASQATFCEWLGLLLVCRSNGQDGRGSRSCSPGRARAWCGGMPVGC